MKVSENWLREWVKPQLDTQQLAAMLTMAGLEVDSVNPVAGVFDQVIVAEVIETSAHPQANKLTLCKVHTGKGEPLNIVCGATNVRRGLKVALAQIGASLPNGLTIKEAKLRGELSQGMLCSASELGLAETTEGILELDEDAPVGMNLREYLLLDDYVLDIDLTPNRADCLSVLGIAREVSALAETALKDLPEKNIVPKIDNQLAVNLQAPEACPYYCGRIITDINSQANTPLWMKERLSRAGVRTTHPVVDVTNYVMLELGQPMHAFDSSLLSGNVVVRFNHANEPLTLLDGREVMLQDKVLVIADSYKAVALAGVMGGSETAVHDGTTTIFLESAYFNPSTITGVARKIGLFTDASQRFERGVDPQMARRAMERATDLLISIVGGNAGPITEAIDKRYLPQEITILFKPTKVKQITGLNISQEKMLSILTGLGMRVQEQNETWRITVPSHRFDVTLDVDLIEEIIRLYGYDNIPGNRMYAEVRAGNINPIETLFSQIGKFFVARSYHETISYSFVDPKLQQVLTGDKPYLNLLNPISSELSQMRNSLWPGLIASMIYNLHRQQTSIKFFESGVVFDVSSGQLKEFPCIAGLLSGDAGTNNWCENQRKFDFYDLKGDLQALFTSLNCQSIQFKQQENTALHPGKSAAIYYNNQLIGWCGVLHPRLADILETTDEVILFELNLENLVHQISPIYRQISKFPQIKRDLALLVDNSINFEQIELLIKSTVDSRLLKSLAVFDVYQGNSIPAGKKSLGLTLTLQDEERTLIDNEINDIINAILKTLKDKLAITLRD